LNESKFEAIGTQETKYNKEIEYLVKLMSTQAKEKEELLSKKKKKKTASAPKQDKTGLQNGQVNLDSVESVSEEEQPEPI
jgi:hypothetical protein